MAWMRMPGQTWSGAAASFLGMWIVMMIAMMLPALMPMLLRFRESLPAMHRPRTAWLTLQLAAAYFLVWVTLGALAFSMGVGLATLAMRVPGLADRVPLLGGVALVIAGAAQSSAWKTRRLACCARRTHPAHPWHAGLRFGWRCVVCCAPLTAVLVVLGVMDLVAMTLVTAAICCERLVPQGPRVARAVGAGIALMGLWILAAAVFPTACPPS